MEVSALTEQKRQEVGKRTWGKVGARDRTGSGGGQREGLGYVGFGGPVRGACFARA